MKNIGLIFICLLFINFSDARPQFGNQGRPWGATGTATSTVKGTATGIGTIGHGQVGFQNPGNHGGLNAQKVGGWRCPGCTPGSADYFG